MGDAIIESNREAMSMITTQSSLLKYDSPVLISKTSEEKVDTKPLPANGRLEPLDSQKAEDILPKILPPVVFEQDGQLWSQKVSATPATRLDVQRLATQLDRKLLQRQARETGICPIRRELYKQTFDEIIRQVTINCAERGLLLLRVRDEIRMTIAAYQTLYESSVAFGMRKALQAEQGKADMETKIKELEEEKKEL